MSQIIDHLADLTGFRDRDRLDAMLAAGLRDLLRAQEVGVYRPVGETAAAHWLTRARIGADDAAPSADPLWADLSDLPELPARPERLRCLREARVLEAADPAGRSGMARSATLFPLQSEHETEGVLEVLSDAPLAVDQRRMVSGILRIYRNMLGLIEYSERDTLTGLLNRKSFDERFLRLSLTTRGDAADAERRREGSAVAFIGVIDIDHFKRVNDTYGHVIGDEVLLLLARQMRATLRWNDQLFRFGGEEFVVLVRCAAAVDAPMVFERLRQAVNGYAFPRVGCVTISVGLSALRATDTPASAFERADRAVYWAKQNGRNRVAAYESLVRDGHLQDEAHEGDVELF